MKELFRVYRHRDFALLWIGAFFSFSGTWVQTVAQGYLVYEITGDKAKLALISALYSVPILLFGPALGAVSDSFHKKKLLVGCQLIMAVNALTLGTLVLVGQVAYWQIALVAIINGFVGAIEMPTRQSIVGKVVPPEDLSAAIPLNAMTFNLARLIGPAIGGLLLEAFGPGPSYLVNGFSYAGIVMAAIAIRADLRALERRPQPVMDLVLEGARFTLRTPGLRTLFILECLVSLFALNYIPLMPAIAKEQLGLGERGLGYAYVSMGVGAIVGLVAVARINTRPYQPEVVRVSMTTFGLALVGLSFATHWAVAYVLFALMAMCAVAHFNTTNTLFQVLSPEALRGRVLAMHVWALSGAGTLGALPFGYLAEHWSLANSLGLAGVLTVLGAGWGWLVSPTLANARIKDGSPLARAVEPASP